MKSLVAAAAVALIIVPAPAHATLQIAADINGVTFFCADQQACDKNPAVGTLEIGDQLLGGVQVNGSIQMSVGTALNPGPQDILNTSSLSVINNNTSPVPIIVTVGDKNFAGPVTQRETSTSGTWQNAIGSTLTTTFFDDPTNAQGANTPGDTPGILLDTFTSTAVAAADSFAHDGSGPITDPGRFGMTESVTGSLIGGASLLSRGQTEIKSAVTPPAVREPSALVLLGTALLGFLGWRSRERFCIISLRLAGELGWTETTRNFAAALRSRPSRRSPAGRLKIRLRQRRPRPTARKGAETGTFRIPHARPRLL
jgi:hypothetical protein